ncbi:hypothetical protein AVEN_150014-1, partial [Araneus ventricosus]
MAIQLQCEKIVDGMGWLVWDLLAQEPNLTMLRQTYGESTEYGGWMGWDWITKGNSETYNVAVSKMPCSRARAKRNRNLLSKDQQYLLDVSNAITLGQCPEDLANRDPGRLLHSSCLTAVNRVL